MLEQSIFAVSLTLTGLDLEDATHVRVKIENGIVFIKPARGTTAGRRCTQDLHEIVDRDGMSAVCVIRGALVSRVNAYILSRGWSKSSPYFVLNPASRGWYSISMQPTASGSGSPLVAIAIVARDQDVVPVRYVPKVAGTSQLDIVTISTTEPENQNHSATE